MHKELTMEIKQTHLLKNQAPELEKIFITKQSLGISEYELNQILTHENPVLYECVDSNHLDTIEFCNNVIDELISYPSVAGSTHSVIHIQACEPLTKEGYDSVIKSISRLGNDKKKVFYHAISTSIGPASIHVICSGK